MGTGRMYYKAIFILYGGALLLCGAIRTALHLQFLDAASGLYLREATPLLQAFQLILFGVVLVLFCLSLLKRVDHDYPVQSRHPAVSLLLIPLSAFLALFIWLGLSVEPIVQSPVQQVYADPKWDRFFAYYQSLAGALAPLSFLGWVLLALAAALFLGMWGLSYRPDPRASRIWRPLEFLARYPALGLLSFLLGLIAAFAGLFFLSAPSLTAMDSDSRWRWIFETFNRILGVLSACALLQACIAGVRRSPRQPVAFLILMPALWQVFTLMSRFHSFSAPTYISDHFLTILFMCFASLFYVGLARALCGFSRKNGRNYAIPSGLAVSLCGFLLVIPNLIYMAVYRAPLPSLSLNLWECLYVLMLSCYSLLFVFSFCRSIKSV